MNPAEHAALTRVRDEVRQHLGPASIHENTVRHVISALRALLDDPDTRGDVLVALGLDNDQLTSTAGKATT